MKENIFTTIYTQISNRDKSDWVTSFYFVNYSLDFYET